MRPNTSIGDTMLKKNLNKLNFTPQEVQVILNHITPKWFENFISWNDSKDQIEKSVLNALNTELRRKGKFLMELEKLPIKFNRTMVNSYRFWWLDYTVYEFESLRSTWIYCSGHVKYDANSRTKYSQQEEMLSKKAFEQKFKDYI